MSNEEEQSFTVRDRRRFNAEESEQAEVTPPSPAQAPPSARVAEEPSAYEALPDEDEAGNEEEYSGELPDVYSMLAMFLSELRSLAWLRMGLVANPSTGKIERDMHQAKVAIDTVAFLATQLESVVSPDEKLPLKALVTDLQMNFVEQSKKG